jgi:hypothetical protein
VARTAPRHHKNKSRRGSLRQRQLPSDTQAHTKETTVITIVTLPTAGSRHDSIKRQTGSSEGRANAAREGEKNRGSRATTSNTHNSKE